MRVNQPEIMLRECIEPFSQLSMQENPWSKGACRLGRCVPYDPSFRLNPVGEYPGFQNNQIERMSIYSLKSILSTIHSNSQPQDTSKDLYLRYRSGYSPTGFNRKEGS